MIFQNVLLDRAATQCKITILSTSDPFFEAVSMRTVPAHIEHSFVECLDGLGERALHY
jgi:hypothetical protein